MRIVGIGVCGPGEADRYMEKTLREYKRLCDDVLIATSNATQKEIDLIESFGFKHYEDNREWGIHQPNIKTDLLTKAGEMKPDWIIALDMDEVFAPEFTREVAEQYAQSGEIGYHFLVVNLYNDEQHFAHDVGIQRFWNVRFYKYLPEYGLQFLRKSLHCGLGPPIVYRYGWHIPFYLLHYGLMLEADRLKKVERYKKYDPTAKHKGRAYYDDLERVLKPRKFEPQLLLKQLAESVDCKKRVPPKLPHAD